MKTVKAKALNYKIGQNNLAASVFVLGKPFQPDLIFAYKDRGDPL